MSRFADLSDLDRFLVGQAELHPKDLAKVATAHFKVSRQAVNRHLRELVGRGLLAREGQTRAVRYQLPVLGEVSKALPNTPDLQEDLVWRDEVLPLLRDVPENVRDICAYGFTEIVNNARDHSESAGVLITARLSAARITLEVYDRGVGIFTKIRTLCALEDERHAVFELTKGKLTTDPERHTGEGIFFTSRMFDTFAILSGTLYLGCREGRDWLLENAKPLQGTAVTMGISPLSSRTSREVFDRYATNQDDYAFRRTHVVVGLARAEGEKLISRSQAKRIMARVERFREVVLDFEGVESIGPAFADEMFRVFRLQHPGVHIVPINTTDEVQRMIPRSMFSEASSETSAVQPTPGTMTK